MAESGSEHKMLCTIFVILLGFLADFSSGTDLTDVTASLFPGGIPNHAVIAAYGDYNADKMIDIFVLSEQGRQLDVILAHENKAYSRKTLLRHDVLKTRVMSVIPADFNGDALMDVLLITPATGETVDISICWGTDDQHQQALAAPVHIMDADSEPTLFDYNQDMLPDLLVYTDNKRMLIPSPFQSNVTVRVFHEMGDEVSVPFGKKMSNAFVDVTGDFMADLVIATDDRYEFWLNEGGQLSLNYTVDWPAEWKSEPNMMVGQPAFSDINQDGIPNLLVPVCKWTDYGEGRQRCYDSAIYGLSHPNDTLKKMFDFNTKFGGILWNLTPPSSSWPGLPITLRFGDYDMDGYPDIIAFAEYGEKNRVVQKALLLQNVACTSGASCLMNRTFSPDINNELSTYDGAILGSFFDLYEDGVLDVLLVTVTTGKQDKNVSHVVRAIRQTSTTDTCFMKVTVTNGLCYKNCLDGRQPYGVNVPGPVVQYSTVSVTGEKQTSSATQLIQSSYFALQLPYVMFGLGLTPNFVDSVSVGIPVLNKQTEETQKREWTQIIPNSQLVVIPYPNTEPERWIVKLFVTPSQSVLITGAALLGTCGFVAGIIGILHWQERREDMKEKRQESHKFHFDAM